MLVTYTDCSAGEYDISYSGKASNVEIYYEPDADLDFVFTDEDGNLVDPESLYKGNYKVQFGLKDAKTGELISSDLLGDPTYEGKYVVNDKEYRISHSGNSGETPVSLDVGDTFTAELTASYLNGYSITKTAKDFGWPDGSLKVAARPVGDIRLEITGGDPVYELSNLEQGGTYTAKVFYQDVQLTGSELEKVDLKWEPEKSNAEILQDFQDDHFDLSLHYKDPSAPLNTKCGKCTVTIHAFYTADGSTETSGTAPLTYKIEDNIIKPEITFRVPQKHFQTSKIDSGKPIKAIVTSNGAKLSPEKFKTLNITADCEGLGYTIIPLAEESAFEIKLDSSGSKEKGKYQITAMVTQKDNLGREVSAEESCKVELSGLPLWLERLILILAILLLIAIIYFVSHIPCLPTKLHDSKRECSMNIGGEDFSSNSEYKAEISGGTLTIYTKASGVKVGVSMSVQPGTDSYLMTPQKKRRALVDAKSIRKIGSGTITELIVGTTQFVYDEEAHKLLPASGEFKNFELRDGNTITYNGMINNVGTEDSYTTTVKLSFKKK